MEFRVQPGTKVADFLRSNRLVDVLEGPLGSGKTKALCIKPMRHAQEQRPSPKDGVRYTRFAMVRNTTPDLKRTTIRSWLECYPENVYGRLKLGAPMGHVFDYDWPGGRVHSEVDFLGLDKDDDIRKLRSGEYTGIFFDELEFIEKSLFDEARSRLRYPPQEHGGPTWRGVCAATNAPPEDHWLPQMTSRVELPLGLRDDEIAALKWPESWGHHLQPAALIERFDQHNTVIGYDVNPKAENLRNLPPRYYEDQIVGQTKAWIDSRLMVRVVLVTEGSPVYPMFKREVHISREILRPHRGYEVYCGLDFGRSPAAIFCQPINNRVQFQYELIGSGEGAAVFAPKVRRFFAENYPDHRLEDVRFYGDPKGQDKGQGDERTAYDIFEANGMKVRAPPGLINNMIATRVDAVSSLLNEMTDGKPRFISSPLCRTFNVGMSGRYCNERDEEGELKPSKNRYSHVCFVAGTQVDAVTGPRSIEGLSVGDLVKTPYGTKPVVAIGNRECDTLALLFSNGSELRCTADHPFWTNRGWVAASELTEADICFDRVSLPPSAAWPSIRSLSSKASAFIGKARAAITTIRLAGGFMSWSGNGISGLSRRDTISTISTAIRRTMSLKISNACRKVSTIDAICASLGVLRNQGPPLMLPVSSCSLSEELIRPGHLIFVGPQDLQPRYGLPPFHCKPSSVTIAETLMRPDHAGGTEADTVRTTASAQRAGRVVTMTKTALAWFVAALSGSTGLPKRKPVRLVAREPSFRERVYNITVADAHCYYANGMLVSNCDAAQYVVLGLGEGRRMTGRPSLSDLKGIQTYQRGRKSMRRVTA